MEVHITGLSFALCICDQRVDHLQDVLITVDIGKRVVVHGFVKHDGVKNLQPIAVSGARLFHSL